RVGVARNLQAVVGLERCECTTRARAEPAIDAADSCTRGFGVELERLGAWSPDRARRCGCVDAARRDELEVSPGDREFDPEHTVTVRRPFEDAVAVLDPPSLARDLGARSITKSKHEGAKSGLVTEACEGIQGEVEL